MSLRIRPLVESVSFGLNCERIFALGHWNTLLKVLGLLLSLLYQMLSVALQSRVAVASTNISASQFGQDGTKDGPGWVDALHMM